MKSKVIGFLSIMIFILGFSTSATALGPFGDGMSTNETGDIDVAYYTGGALYYEDTNGNQNTISTSSFNEVGGYGDLDNDGQVEIAVIRGPNDPGDLGYIELDGTFTDLNVQAEYIGGVTDFDSDGDQDILYNSDLSEISMIDDNGNSQVIVSSGAEFVGDTGDVDSDGDPEVVFITGSTDVGWADINSGGIEGSTGTPTSCCAADGTGGIADYDGDGTLEIAFNNFDNTGYTDINGNGGSFDSNNKLVIGGAADWDEDGIYEVATAKNGVTFIDRNGQENQVYSGSIEDIGAVYDFDSDNVDQTPPEIQFNPSTPSDGTTFTNQDWIFVNVTATDNENLATVTEEFDGINFSFNTNSGDYYWTNHTGLSNGDYTFQAFAEDAEANTNSTEARTVTIDNDVTPPSITNGDVVDNVDGDGAVKDGESVTIQATVTDARSSINNVNATVFGNTYTLTDGNADNVFDFTTTVPTPTSDGSKNLQVEATDSEGNYGSNTFNDVIVVDNTDPSISSITITDNDDGDSIVSTGQSFTVSANINSVSSIVTAEATIFGNTYTLTDGNADDVYDVTSTVPSTTDGTYSADIYAEDNVGNNKSKTGGSITVDSTSPVISNIQTSISGSDNTLSIGETLTVTADVTDSNLESVSGDFIGNSLGMSNTGGNTYEGSYTLQAGDGSGSDTASITATDVADNSDTANTGTINYDSDVPLITNFDLEQTDAQQYNVSFDSDLELETINMTFDGQTYTRADFTEVGSFTYFIEFTRGPGQYTATLNEAREDSGNNGATGESDTVYPPVVNVEAETPNNGTTVFEEFRVNFTASDQDGSINETYFLVNGGRVNGSDVLINDQQTSNIELKMFAVNNFGTTVSETREFRIQNKLIGLEAFGSDEIYAIDSRGVFRTDVNETIDWSSNVSDVTSIARSKDEVWVASNTGSGTIYKVDRDTGDLTDVESLEEVAASEDYFWGYRKTSGNLNWKWESLTGSGSDLGQYDVSPITSYEDFDASINDDGDSTIALSNARLIRLNQDGSVDFDKSSSGNYTAATSGYSIFGSLNQVTVYEEGGGTYGSYSFPQNPDQDITDLNAKAGTVFAVLDGRNNTARLDLENNSVTVNFTNQLTNYTPTVVDVESLLGYSGDERGYIYEFQAFNNSEFNVSISRFDIISKNITVGQRVPVEVDIQDNYPVTRVEVKGRELSEVSSGTYSGYFVAQADAGNYTATARVFTSEGVVDTETAEYEVSELESSVLPDIDINFGVIVPALFILLILAVVIYIRRWSKKRSRREPRRGYQ